MREKKPYMVITFHTTMEAIGVEKYCREHKIPGRLVPVPREISASCGLCWRMNPEEYGEFKEQLLASEREYDQIAEVFFAE